MKTLALAALIATTTPKLLDTCPPKEDGGCQRYKNHPTVCASWGEEGSEVQGCILPIKCGHKFMDTNYTLMCLETLGAMANLAVGSLTVAVTFAHLM